jgi:hypothetical protein
MMKIALAMPKATALFTVNMVLTKGEFKPYQ